MSHLRSENASEAAITETEEEENLFTIESKRKNRKRNEKQAEEKRKEKISKVKKKQGITIASWNTRGKKDERYQSKWKMIQRIIICIGSQS